MTVFEAIQKRYSCRAYQEKPIENEKLDKLLEAARLAPSAKNIQDWRFIVVVDKQVKDRVAEQTNRPSAFGKALPRKRLLFYAVGYSQMSNQNSCNPVFLLGRGRPPNQCLRKEEQLPFSLFYKRI